jgi:hypothetical protein
MARVPPPPVTSLPKEESGAMKTKPTVKLGVQSKGIWQQVANGAPTMMEEVEW